MGPGVIEAQPLPGPPTKADAAYILLRNEILLGNLPPGRRVDLAQFAEQFDLSVTPFREALRRLEAEHLVRRSAHRDVVVEEISRAEARALVEMRDVLDVAAVRFAAERMTDAEINGAAKILEEADERAAVTYLWASGIPVASAGSFAVNRAFHRMLYCGSHNSVLIQSRDSLSVRTERYVILSRRLNPLSNTPHHDLHRALLDAVRVHDVEGAAALMTVHYSSVGGDFAETIFGAEGED